jgi:hypothetical protein
MIKQFFTLLLICLFSLLLFFGCNSKEEAGRTSDITEETAAYLCDMVTDSNYGGVGGDWIVIGLARSEYDVPDDFFDNYYNDIVDYVKSSGGILNQTKYTEYSRLILALTAIGKDPTDVGGYNLLTPLGDYEGTLNQGINGPIWALIALDSGHYEIPVNPDASTQATRDMYLEKILSAQLSDGGFALSSGNEATADVDLTAMALTALANYTDRSDVASAVEKGLTCLSSLQNENGGFICYGEENAESVAQVVVALTTLNIGINDSRFVKNDHTVIDNLLTFRLEDGGFCHTASLGRTDQMATEQAFYALVAFKRYESGLSPLYRMDDQQQGEVK